MKRLAAVLFLLVAPFAFGRTRATRSAVLEWTTPPCELTGLPHLRWVDRDGTVHGSAADPAPDNRTAPAMMTVALGVPANTLWAVDEAGTIHRSSDAGCTWTVAAAVPEVLTNRYPTRIAARHTERTYVYTGARPGPSKQSSIVRLTGGTVETFVHPDLGGIAALEVDLRDSLHVRTVARWGLAWESRDGGATWSVLNPQAGIPYEVRSVAFDPTDFDHILAGTLNGGLFRSRDGGRTWQRELHVIEEVEGIVFSPTDPRVLYVGVVPSKLLRSTDGGKTFTQIDVAIRGPYARLRYIDGFFAVHPRDPLTFASEGDHGVGIKVTKPDGTTFTTPDFENVQEVLWAPSGVMYYLRLVIRSR